MYVVDADFGHIWLDVQVGKQGEYFVHDGCLFKGSQFCIPDCLL